MPLLTESVLVRSSNEIVPPMENTEHYRLEVKIYDCRAQWDREELWESQETVRTRPWCEKKAQSMFLT